MNKLLIFVNAVTVSGLVGIAVDTNSPLIWASAVFSGCSYIFSVMHHDR